MSGGGGGRSAAEKEAAALADKKSECVRVVVRVRPMSTKEKQEGRMEATIVDSTRGEVSIRNPKADKREAPKVFTFDQTYGPNCTQREIYDITASPIVESSLQGFNGTIFAYGQTGAGKTHTMEGRPDPVELRGIIPNSFKHIFDKIDTDDKGGIQYLVRASYLEIYNEEIRDLLSKDPKNRLDLKESVDSGVYVKDLTSFVVKSAFDIDTVMQAGKKNRSVGATLMNATSSRSHSIFTVTVETVELGADGEDHIRVGKLNMVDLAGSERQSKTGATGSRLKEATKINLSLSALGNVISALVDASSSHIPYRDSKLTRLLQDSLGGNTKTVMIANCGPADYNYDETLSTLRYASRAKNIKNKPKINEDPKDAMLREFQDEIKRLRAQLATASANGAAASTIMIDGKAVPVPTSPTKPRVEVVEKIVKVEVEKVIEVEKGLSEEKVKELEEAARAKAEEERKRAEEELQAYVKKNSKTEEERKRLMEELESKRNEQEEAERQKGQLQKKLQAMEEKLIVGGRIMDKAVKQEAELRRAQAEIAERKHQEESLARELEEANEFIEEQYASMAEEVEMKTKKLQKVWGKFQAAKTEIKDLQREFQREREELLDNIRHLSRVVKSKTLIIDHFIPPEEVAKVEERMTWSDEKDQWDLPRPDLAGNALARKRPMAQAGRRPTSDYARTRQMYDTNPRYRADNVASMELDMAERTTYDYSDAAMHRRLNEAMSEALEGVETDEVVAAAPENLPGMNPYFTFGGEEGGGSSDRKRSSRKRPGTASRRRPARG